MNYPYAFAVVRLALEGGIGSIGHLRQNETLIFLGRGSLCALRTAEKFDEHHEQRGDRRIAQAGFEPLVAAAHLSKRVSIVDHSRFPAGVSAWCAQRREHIMGESVSAMTADRDCGGHGKEISVNNCR